MWASKGDLSPLKLLYSTSTNWTPHFSLAANRKTQLVAHRYIPKWDLLGSGQPLQPRRYATAAALGGWRESLLGTEQGTEPEERLTDLVSDQMDGSK